MSNEYSNFGRQPGSSAKSGLAGTSVYLVFGGAVAIAAIAGALVAFLILRTGTAPQQTAVVNRPNVAAPGQAPNAQAPAPIQWTKVGTYGSWEVRCQNNAAKTCAAWLDIINQQSKQIMMSWVVGPACLVRDGRSVIATGNSVAAG